jgi:predicted ATP-grasp superfamily ATP-dependent carboligase
MVTTHTPALTVPAVILTGGSEILSVSIAEELREKNIPLVIISLGIKSIIRDIPGVTAYKQLSWPPDNNATCDELTTFLEGLPSGHPSFPWPVFCTEDGGARFLFEYHNQLQKYFTIFGARALPMKGLDKAELFLFLQNHGCEDLLTPTQRLDHPDDIEKSFKEWGSDVVVKPALKPCSMKADLDKKGAKILIPRDNETMQHFIRRCSRCWAVSRTWIAQKKLPAPVGGEVVWWGARLRDGSITGLTATERWKYPRHGGTGCWLETNDYPELHAGAERILKAIDFYGVVELPFLKEKDGHWLLLEMNPRPWLQVALARVAGFPLVQCLYENTTTGPSKLRLEKIPLTPIRSWVNTERFLLAALSGEYGDRRKSLQKFWTINRSADYRAIYSSRLRYVRLRWWLRLLRKICGL